MAHDQDVLLIKIEIMRIKHRILNGKHIATLSQQASHFSFLRGLSFVPQVTVRSRPLNRGDLRVAQDGLRRLNDIS